MPLLGDNKKAEKRVSEEAQIVFCTECDDADGFDMYLFDLKTKYIQKVPFFSKELVLILGCILSISRETTSR